MDRPRQRSFLFFICLLLGPTPLYAIQFDLLPDTSRCISEEYADGMTKITVRAVGRVLDRVYATAHGPQGKVVYHKPIISKADRLPLAGEDLGMYKICFQNTAREKQRVEVAVSTEQDDSLSKNPGAKDQLQPLQQLFRRAELTVLGVSRELDNVRQREAILRETSELTNSRIQWFSIFSIIVLLAVSSWQIFYLRNFFRSKKLL